MDFGSLVWIRRNRRWLDGSIPAKIGLSMDYIGWSKERVLGNDIKHACMWYMWNFKRKGTKILIMDCASRKTKYLVFRTNAKLKHSINQYFDLYSKYISMFPKL
jgi:hypothetical protein